MRWSHAANKLWKQILKNDVLAAHLWRALSHRFHVAKRCVIDASPVNAVTSTIRNDQNEIGNKHEQPTPWQTPQGSALPRLNNGFLRSDSMSTSWTAKCCDAVCYRDAAPVGSNVLSGRLLPHVVGMITSSVMV